MLTMPRAEQCSFSRLERIEVFMYAVVIAPDVLEKKGNPLADKSLQHGHLSASPTAGR